MTTWAEIWHPIRMTTDKIVALNMRRLRPATGRSQRECGELVGVRGATWQAWEVGKHDIPASRLDKIAIVLGIDVPTLVTRPAKPAPMKIEDVQRDDDEEVAA